jgi:hypothetical protein
MAMVIGMKRWAAGLMLVGLGLLAAACGPSEPKQKAFDSPEQAVQALLELIGKHDERAVNRLFGPGSMDLFESGDEVADRADFDRLKELIETGVAFEEVADNTQVALFGPDAWPFPIPLVKGEGGWRFDTAAGREELLNRRIGHNELQTLTALHEIVDAQREYASAGRDGKPPAFAARFRSSEGKHDGLYWPQVDGEVRSPLGDLLAGSERAGPTPRPFHGYQYRMLTGQGPNAPGGEKSYLDKDGLLTGGFAVIAWPEKYGNSGVMTFMVNQRGIVYQKDLGAETEAVASAIKAYDPGEAWSPTADELQVVAD